LSQSEAPPCRGCCNFNKKTKRWKNACIVDVYLMVRKNEYYKLTETL